MKRVRHEDKIDPATHEARQVIGVSHDELAVFGFTLDETMACDVEHPWIDVNPEHAAGNFGDWQREPAIAAADIDNIRPSGDTDRSDHARRIWPKRFPPAGGWHLGSLEEARKRVGHRRPRCCSPRPA